MRISYISSSVETFKFKDNCKLEKNSSAIERALMKSAFILNLLCTVIYYLKIIQYLSNERHF